LVFVIVLFTLRRNCKIKPLFFFSTVVLGDHVLSLLGLLLMLLLLLLPSRLAGRT